MLIQDQSSEPSDIHNSPFFRRACGHVDQGTCPHQVLAATLTLSQPGGADHAHHILVSTPSFESHRRACMIQKGLSSYLFFTVIVISTLQKNALEKKNILHCKGRIKTSATIFFSFVLHSESGLYISDLERPQKSGAVHHCTLHCATRPPCSLAPRSRRRLATVLPAASASMQTVPSRSKGRLQSCMYTHVSFTK